MAQWIKAGGSLPNDPGLLAELCAPSYSNDNASNRLQIESKDAIRSRLGLSPDKADSLAISFAYPVVRAAAWAVGASAPGDDDERGGSVCAGRGGGVASRADMVRARPAMRTDIDPWEDHEEGYTHE